MPWRAEPEVLTNCECLYQLEVLVNHTDPSLPGTTRISWSIGPPGNLYRATVRTEPTAQYLDKCALAGAVLAEQGNNFSLANCEADPVKSNYR
jgi:hypothetical protein